MYSKSSYLKVFFFSGILIGVIFTGCIYESEERINYEKIKKYEIQLDQPSILPDWQDREYHDYIVTSQMLKGFNAQYADLVDVFTIGKSVLGRNIWCIRITNEKNNSAKNSCLFDGCIHGNEWESGEAILYLAEYLLINFNTNLTVKKVLNTSKVYIVPIVNPDGRQENTRWNENGVDLNRNFDVFFGRLLGHCVRLGKLLGRIKIPIVKIPFIDSYYGWFYNCGRRPFSEPETQALRDLMKTLDNHGFSFYINCHTPTHNILTPWLAFKPPFEMIPQEEKVYDYVKDWVEENTEFEAYRNGRVQRGGLAMDWCLKEFRIPSFIFETYSMDYVNYYGKIFTHYEHEHHDLVYWMKASLPIFIYLLVNIENLYKWEIPDIQPPLPGGVPPESFS